MFYFIHKRQTLLTRWQKTRTHTRVHTLGIYILHITNVCLSTISMVKPRDQVLRHIIMYTVVHTRANAIQLLQVRYESKSILPILRTMTAALIYTRIRPRSFPGSSSPPTSRHRPRRAASAN